MVACAHEGSSRQLRRAAATAALLFAFPTGAGAQTGIIDVGDARIYYESAGRGTPVVLIHGWAGLRSPRLRQIDRLSDISADPGDLRALLDTLGIGSAVLVGHSAGTQVAYRFAAAFPDRVAGLVLYGAGTPPLGFPIRRDEPRADLRAVARRSGLDSLLTFVLAQPAFAGLQTPEIEGRIRAMWATYSGKDLLEDHPPSDRFPPARFDDVKRWPIPTAFIVGDREAPFTRLIADSLARWMPNARGVVIAGGAHGVHFQQPERFNAALLAFLTGVARGR